MIDEGPDDPGPGVVATRYDVGSPRLVDLYVAATGGSDAMTNPGTSMSSPLATITAAWDRTANRTTTGYRINMLPGTHGSGVQIRLSERQAMGASRDHPIIIQSSNPMTHATISGELSFVRVSYVYIQDLDVDTPGGDDVVHYEAGDYVLIRRSHLRGRNGKGGTQEGLKANQTQHIYVEDSDIEGAWDNPVDHVGVQYGHYLNNRIHEAGDWCMYLKGGSSYFVVDGNEFYNCNVRGTTGGFTAGQGTGFEFMVSPWIHHEANDIKFVNNVVHDTGGAGIGINGGYNILMEHNTLYNVGTFQEGGASAIEIVFGRRGCDGFHDICQRYSMSGGWGIDGEEEQFIPNRNIYIYNNILYNPPPSRTRFQTISIAGQVMPPMGSNVPVPNRGDVNVRIRGNILFDGGPMRMTSDIIGDSMGCQDTGTTATCNLGLLLRDNQYNTLEPQFVNAAMHDFHPRPGGNLMSLTGIRPRQFDWANLPTRPMLIPAGTPTNTVRHNRENMPRNVPGRPGAY